MAMKMGGKRGAKQPDFIRFYWTVLDKEKSLNRLVKATEGLSWWRWGRVELPVQTNPSENVLQA
jgi:hypothetical protein